MFYNITDNYNKISNIEPLTITHNDLKVENKDLSLKIDTESPITSISKQDFNEFKHFKNLEIKPISRTFKTYIGNRIISYSILNVKTIFRVKIVNWN